MSYSLDELNWAFSQERDVKEFLVRHISEVLGTPIIVPSGLTQDWGVMQEITGQIFEIQQVAKTTLNIHDATLIPTSNVNNDGYHINGDVIIKDTIIESDLKATGSRFLFSGDSVVMGVASDALLSITLNDKTNKHCFVMVDATTYLTVTGALEINLQSMCDIIIAGTLEAHTIKITAPFAIGLTEQPKIFILEGAEIRTTKPSYIKGAAIVNYGSADFSNFILNVGRFDNNGSLTINNSTVCSTSFLNNQNSITALGANSTIVVKDSFINFGLVGINDEVLILNSKVCSTHTVDAARSKGFTGIYKGKGVFYNTGSIIGSYLHDLLRISTFQLLVNAVPGEIDAKLNIHTARESVDKIYDSVRNIGGFIYLHDGSTIATALFRNFAVNPSIQASYGLVIVKGSVDLDIQEEVYTLESCISGDNKAKIRFLKPVKVSCVAQGKPCKLSGNFIGTVEIQARTLGKDLSVVSVSAEDARVQKLSESKIIPLHEMGTDGYLAWFNSLQPQSTEAMQGNIDEDRCLEQFYYVTEQNKNMPSFYPGLAEQLCNMGFSTTYKKGVLFNGNQLNQFLRKYEMLIFREPLDVWFDSSMHKMHYLLNEGALVKQQNPTFELLKPLPVGFDHSHALLWPVEIQNSQGTSIIVPYLYIPSNFKKEGELSTIVLKSESRLLITGIINSPNSELIIESKNIKSIADKDRSDAEDSTSPGVIINCQMNNPKGAIITLPSGSLGINGALINKGIIRTIGYSLIEARDSIINFGQIIGSNLMLKSKTIMMHVLLDNVFENEYTKQVIKALENPEVKILNQKTQKVVSRPEINLDGVLILDAEGLIKIEAGHIKAKKKIGIRSHGKVFIIPIGLYDKISNWWGSGYSETERLNFLTTELEAQEIEIISEDNTVIVSTKFIGHTFIESNNQLLLDVVSNIEATQKTWSTTKKKYGGLKKKITTWSEYYRLLNPIQSEFIGGVDFVGRTGLKLLGVKVDNAEINRIMAGTKDKPASVELYPAVRIEVHDIQKNTKTTFCGFKIGKSRVHDRSLIQHHILNVIQSDKGFYGYSHGKWLQFATQIESGQIYIHAKEEVTLGSVQDIEIIESYARKSGLGAWFDSNERGVSVGAGWRHKENRMRSQEYTSVPNILIADDTSIGSEGIVYLFGIFNNTGTLTIEADKVDFGVGENEKYISASAFSYQIGINAGIKFGYADAKDAIKNLGQQKTDTTIGKVNTAFAAIQAYTAVGELLTNVAKGGVGGLFSAGAWVSFNMQSSKQNIEQKTVTPTIINARHIVIKANDVHMKALQMFAWDVYLKALRLNIEPAEISFKRESSGKNFGFSMGLDLSKILGDKTAQQIDKALSALKLGRLPVEVALPSFALNSGNTNQIRHLQTTIHVSGTLTIEVALEATIRGADIIAGTLIARFDDLILESVRDIIKTKEWSTAVGFSDDALTKLNHFGLLCKMGG